MMDLHQSLVIPGYCAYSLLCLALGGNSESLPPYIQNRRLGIHLGTLAPELWGFKLWDEFWIVPKRFLNPSTLYLKSTSRDSSQSLVLTNSLVVSGNGE